MKLLREIFLGEEKIFTVNAVVFNVMILAASVAFLYLFSYSTSPRYSSWGDDSAIFQAVGRCWAEGVLPYVGAFENKGPLLFAIDALGYAIAPRVGIMLLQIPFMYFSFLFMWRAVELYWSRRATFVIWLLMIFWRASVFYEGNRTEEYSIPFVMAATYFFLRWLKNSADEKFFLPPTIGFVYGAGFGACVLLRTTNALPICCYVFLTTIFLLQAHSFKNIGQNFLSFVAGFAMICMPFVVYFAAHGALYEMLYGTIFLNVQHATGYNPTFDEMLTHIAPHIIFRCNVLFWLIAASFFVLVLKRDSKLAWSGLVAGSAMLFMLIKSRPFYGYPEIIAGLLPIMFAVLRELKTIFLPTLKKILAVKNFSLKRLFCKAAIMTTVALLLISVGLQIFLVNIYFTSDRWSVANTHFDAFQKNIPAAERNSVVMWGESLCMGNFILETGIKPRCRFFGNIEMFFAKSDPAVVDEWIQNVRGDYPKWIVYGALDEEFSGDEMNYFKFNFRRQRNSRVEEVLAEKYFLTDETELYGQLIKLYRLRE